MERIKVRTTVSRSTAAPVNTKPKEPSQFQLIPALLQHPDGTEAFHFCPVCDSCGQPILDQADANVCIESEKEILFESPLELLGRVGATEVRRLPGVVRFFHKSHDAGKITPWFPAETVFRKQRIFAEGSRGAA
jgi:hypothetical protein